MGKMWGEKQKYFCIYFRIL